MARLIDEKKKAYRITATLKDFDGDVQKWKDSFYELWRYDMTFSFTYDIYVTENCVDGVFVALTVKESYKDNTLRMMESLGYKNVHVGEETVGVVWAYDHDELDGIDLIYYDI